MNCPAQPSSSEWLDAVQSVLAPHLHQIPYGNLRTELTRWDDAGQSVANLAIVYEVPGGSTNQINISYSEPAGVFAYLSLECQDECTTTALEDVLQMVRDAVERIPAIRKRRLAEDIDRWAHQGMSQRDLFQKMTKLLENESLLGGTITMQEMKHGINHILQNYRSTAG